jgi:hypothetical protein
MYSTNIKGFDFSATIIAEVPKVQPLSYFFNFLTLKNKFYYKQKKE